VGVATDMAERGESWEVCGRGGKLATDLERHLGGALAARPSVCRAATEERNPEQRNPHGTVHGGASGSRDRLGDWRAGGIPLARVYVYRLFCVPSCSTMQGGQMQLCAFFKVHIQFFVQYAVPLFSACHYLLPLVHDPGKLNQSGFSLVANTGADAVGQWTHERESVPLIQYAMNLPLRSRDSLRVRHRDARPSREYT
jgi:hypothetical protein